MNRIPAGLVLPPLPETPKSPQARQASDVVLLFARHRSDTAPGITAGRLTAGNTRTHVAGQLGNNGSWVSCHNVRQPFSENARIAARRSDTSPTALATASKPPGTQMPAPRHVLEQRNSQAGWTHAYPQGAKAAAHPLPADGVISRERMQLSETRLPAKGSASESVSKAAERPLPTGSAILAMRKEISKINLLGNASNLKGSFLRTDSAEISLVGRLLAPQLVAPAERLMKNLCETLKSKLDQLSANPSLEAIDQALVATYRQLVTDFRTIEYSDALRQVSRAARSALDSAAQEQGVGQPEGKKRQIDSTAAALKENIGKAMLLRLLSPHLTNMLSKNDSPLHAQVNELNTLLARILEPHATGGAATPSFRANQFVTLLQANINGAVGQKQVAAFQTCFPELLEFARQTRLDDVVNSISQDNQVR